MRSSKRAPFDDTPSVTPDGILDDALGDSRTCLPRKTGSALAS
jgi:hypothetical protein